MTDSMGTEKRADRSDEIIRRLEDLQEDVSQLRDQVENLRQGERRVWPERRRLAGPYNGEDRRQEDRRELWPH